MYTWICELLSNPSIIILDYVPPSKYLTVTFPNYFWLKLTRSIILRLSQKLTNLCSIYLFFFVTICSICLKRYFSGLTPPKVNNYMSEWEDFETHNKIDEGQHGKTNVREYNRVMISCGGRVKSNENIKDKKKNVILWQTVSCPK